MTLKRILGALPLVSLFVDDKHREKFSAVQSLLPAVLGNPAEYEDTRTLICPHCQGKVEAEIVVDVELATPQDEMSKLRARIAELEGAAKSPRATSQLIQEGGAQ